MHDGRCSDIKARTDRNIRDVGGKQGKLRRKKSGNDELNPSRSVWAAAQ